MMILASNNKKKLIEMQAILEELGIELICQRDYGIDLEVEENGSTFAENAYLKASAITKLTGKPAVADDSGLVVEALGGAPGIYSARYGGEACKSDEERVALLLKNLDGQADRRAKFVSAIACTLPDGRMLHAQGEVQGLITAFPMGEGGFGYDPVFYVPEKGMTMAQMPAAEKNKISHRGRALEEFKRLLQSVKL